MPGSHPSLIQVISSAGAGGTLSNNALNVCFEGGAMLQYFCTLRSLFLALLVLLAPPLISATMYLSKTHVWGHFDDACTMIQARYPKSISSRMIDMCESLLDEYEEDIADVFLKRQKKSPMREALSSLQQDGKNPNATDSPLSVESVHGKTNTTRLSNRGGKGIHENIKNISTA